MLTIQMPRREKGLLENKDTYMKGELNSVALASMHGAKSSKEELSLMSPKLSPDPRLAGCWCRQVSAGRENHNTF